jgi:O-antigen ligase
MATSPKKAAVWQGLLQTRNQAALRSYLLGLMLPALFALLVSATIRLHSLSPVATLPSAVANLLAVTAVASLLLMAAGRRVRPPADIAVLLGAFGASAALSVLGSGNIDVSLLRLELYLATALLATAVYLAYRDEDRIPLESYFLAVALVHLPFLLAVILWIKELEPPFWHDGVRVADFANVRHFGYVGFLAATSGAALGLLSRKHAVTSFVLSTAALFGVIMTGSRAGLLCWILFVVLACGFSQVRLRAALQGLIVLTSSAGLVWYLDRSGILPSPNIFRRVASLQAGTESFDASRLQIWIDAVGQIAARPLFGSGPEGYLLSGCCDRRVLQAHNFVLQFLMEFGLIGCAIAALLVARAIVGLGGASASMRLILATRGNRLLACLLAAFLAFSLIDQTMYHLVPLLHLALFVGLFAAGLAHARVGGESRTKAAHHA